MKPASDILATASLPREARVSHLADLCELTKPRMNFLVLVTTAVGFYMTGGSSAGGWLLVHALLGTALTAAGASVLNQYVERHHDALMPRTRKRPIPAGRIAPVDALLLGVALSVAGILYLTLAVNVLTALLGAVTLGTYVLLYTPLKRVTSFCTVIGAIPGAIPPMMGFTAAQGALSPQALALFAILFIWQMPHFLAIAILYKDDYAAGGFKMLPVVDEQMHATSRQIVLYGLALIPVSLIPAILQMSGAVYFTAAVLLGLAFLSCGLSCANSRSRRDARTLFFASIIYLPLLLAAMMMDRMSI